jgi:hypothetical protein
MIQSNVSSTQGTEFDFISSQTKSNKIKETLIKNFPEYEKVSESLT